MTYCIKITVKDISGYAENIDETSIKPQNKQITELTTDLNQIVDISNERKTSDSVEPLKANHENDYEGNGSKTEGFGHLTSEIFKFFFNCCR